MKPYQPSNGTEGSSFIDTYCMKCMHCDPDPEGKKQCMILCNSMAYDINDPEYPNEWIYDEQDKSKCTKYQKWDWSLKGNPDDTENPNYVIPIDPNQLQLQL